MHCHPILNYSESFEDLAHREVCLTFIKNFYSSFKKDERTMKTIECKFYVLKFGVRLAKFDENSCAFDAITTFVYPKRAGSMSSLAKYPNYKPPLSHHQRPVSKIFFQAGRTSSI